MLTKYIVCVIICVVIAVIDVKKYIIPDGLLLILFLFFLTFDFFVFPDTVALNLAQGLGIFFLFYLIYVSVTGLGFGDVKLVGVLAYGFGFFSTIFICLLASLSGLFYILCFSIKNKEYTYSKLANIKLPFAPFLTLGVFLVGIVDGVVL